MRTVVAILLVTVLAGCGGSSASTGGGGTGADGSEAAAAATPPPEPARVAIRAAASRPDRGVRVTARRGTLTKVVVSTGGKRMPGSMNAKGTAWRTDWPLGVGKRYTVRATAKNAAGEAVTRRRAVTTMTPEQTFAPRTIMADGETYGVGMPLIFYFDDPDVDRKAVERSMELKTSKPVVGSWYWSDTCRIVPLCLFFRPKTYWKPGTTVRWTAHADGVRFKPGVYGDTDLRGSMKIGRDLRVVANTQTHSMRLIRNGKRMAKWPMSAGKPGTETPNGAYLSIEKRSPERMVGADYDQIVNDAVRISWSGVYLHSAPWSVGSQGVANVSHGCINLSPENAATYFQMSIPGDPVTIKGSTREGVFDDGWTVWFKSWKAWKRGSALDEAVRAGPDGSAFFSA